ncbi:MAG: hypothetical protein LUG21_05050 [Clostridiales bacterium]|nr:hypothetical protein [Clostridiales bacterium]
MQSLDKMLVYQDYDINKGVKIRNAFNLLFSIFLLIASVYALKMFVIPYCNSELIIKSISIFDGKKLGDLENTLVPDIYRLTAFFPELDAELYVKWSARLLIISAISIPIVFAFNIFNSLFMFIRANSRHRYVDIIFTVTDISLCIVTYLSLLTIAVSVIHFTIMFIISVLNIGNSLFCYAVLWSIAMVIFIVFAAIGIKHKVYRLIHLHNSRENLLTYLIGVLICLLPLVISTLTVIIIGIIVFILILGFLLNFAFGVGIETSRRN